MTTVLHAICLVVGVLILLHKLFGLMPGQRADPTTLAFCLYVGLSALSYLVLLPPVYATIDRWTRMPNSAGMCTGIAVIGLTIAQQYLLMHWTYPPDVARRKVQRRFALLGPIFVLYVMTYFIFAPRQQLFDDFYVQYTHQLTQAPYLVIYITACVIGQVDVVRHCWRYAQIANRLWLRRGMLTTAAGGAMILVYCVIRIADLVAGPLGGDLRKFEPVAWTCGDVGSMLALIGWVLPTVGTQLSGAVVWMRNYRTYRRLYPLWDALYREAPTVALDPSPSAIRDALRLRNLEFWLQRRVVEIQDGQRALQLRDGEMSAAIAVAAARAGRREDVLVSPEDRDLNDEIKWLTELSNEFVAYRRSYR